MSWLDLVSLICLFERETSCWSTQLLPPIFSNYRKSVREEDDADLINVNKSRSFRDSLAHVLQCHFCFSFPNTGQWSATGTTHVVTSLTTHPWILGVLVQRLTLHPGWSPLLRMRWPSRPHVAPHTCGGRTRTRTWPQSPCLDSPGRSVSRCDSKGQRPATWPQDWPGAVWQGFLILEACSFPRSARPSMSISL